MSKIFTILVKHFFVSFWVVHIRNILKLKYNQRKSARNVITGWNTFSHQSQRLLTNHFEYLENVRIPYQIRTELGTIFRLSFTHRYAQQIGMSKQWNGTVSREQRVSQIYTRRGRKFFLSESVFQFRQTCSRIRHSVLLDSP